MSVLEDTLPLIAIKGRILSFDTDPVSSKDNSYTYIERGVVLIDGGYIAAVGENISILSFVNKNTGVYVVFSLGTLVVLYRVIEWHFFIRGSKKFDKMN